MEVESPAHEFVLGVLAQPVRTQINNPNKLVNVFIWVQWSANTAHRAVASMNKPLSSRKPIESGISSKHLFGIVLMARAI